MTKKKMFGLMVAIIISTELCANEIPLNSNHPDQYTVVKNDNLWAIEEKFLKHPWQFTNGSAYIFK